MGPSRILIRSLSCVLGTLMCVSALSVHAEPRARKPLLISGTARLEDGVYTASANGAVIELPSRARLRVAPEAKLRVFPLPQLLALTPGPRTWTWSFALQAGRVDVELPKTGRNAVLVTMGKLSATVTAGDAAFQVENGDATTVNLEGDVRTLLDKRWQTVPVGWLSTLSKEDPSASPRPGLTSPALEAGQRIWFSPSERVVIRGYRFSPVPGAERYDVRLKRLTDGQLIEQQRTIGSSFPDAFTPVAPGRYALATRSVDAHGIEGSWGPEAELRVIGLVLPPGGYVTPEAIFLGVGQQVQFTNTDGLEMTYVGAGRYFPAVQGAGLYRGQRTVVGFRMPGTLDTAVARLEPRALYADVHIGPERALWPRDAITIDIQLKSKAGAEVPAFVNVVPRVTLGLDPLDVKFEQIGNTYHAVVPPSDTPGPWIVRVDVVDQYGVALGHDFLEVAPQPHKKATVAIENDSAHRVRASASDANAWHSARQPITARSD